MNVNNRHVLITGATGGIGRAIAAELVTRGACVHIVGRDSTKLDTLARQLELSRHGGGAICADIENPDDREKIRSAFGDAGRRLDMLINCAGVGDFGRFQLQQQTAIEHLIHTNVTATILLTHHLLPLLLQSQHGRIVNIGSTFGSIGYPGFAVYSATKFALRGFSEALRRELADTRVKVLYISPRATRTALNNHLVCEMNRLLGIAMDEPETVAAAVMRLIAKDKHGARFLGWPERLFVKINNVLPGLVDASLLKQLSTIMHYATRSTETK